MKTDYVELHNLFKIQTKSAPYSMLFKPNKVQRHYIANWSSRDLILKARQHGMSTLIQLDHLNVALTLPDIKCATIANTLPNAQELFGKVSYALNSFPNEYQYVFETDTNNTSKLTFKHNNSSIIVSASARSATVQRLHVSEFAHMQSKLKREVFTGSLQAVPQDGYAVIETTANGQDEFYDLWRDAKAGKNEWKPHFYNWVWNDGYRVEPPVTSKWKKEYDLLAKKYALIRDIQKVLKLDDAQFYWYYLKARSLRGDVKQEYPSTDEEAFLATGSTVFNLYSIQQIVPNDPIEIMYSGDLLVWEYPREGHDYIIGGDTSEGDINSDFCVAAVLDARTGKQVAELHGRWKDYEFANKLAKLGEWYNWALIAVERNNHGHSVINSLEHTNEYPNMYVHDKRYGGDDKIGWPTTSKTKPLMLTSSGGIVEAIDEGYMEVNSQGFIDECRTFIYIDGKGKNGMGADEGKHDDRVMAWAIAWQCREQALMPRDANGNILMLG